MPQPLTEQILHKIQAQRAHWVCSPHDFLDLGSRAAVQKALARLVKENKLRRVRHGLYDLPVFSTFLNRVGCSHTEEIVKAIGRKTGHQFYMIGAKAANLMGLCNQVPARTVYITNGYSRSFTMGKQTITLRHAPPHEIQEAGKTHGIVFQALRNIDKDHVTPEMIQHLQEILPREVKDSINTEMPSASDWLYPVLQEIIQQEK